MIRETMDEEWTGRETADEILGETVDGETADETAEGTWEESMGATRDEEDKNAAVSKSQGRKKMSLRFAAWTGQRKSRDPAARSRQQIEGRHIKMLVRELLPYVILTVCMGIMVSGALAFRRAQIERMARDVLQEYEEQFLHE